MVPPHHRKKPQGLGSHARWRGSSSQWDQVLGVDSDLGRAHRCTLLLGQLVELHGILKLQ